MNISTPNNTRDSFAGEDLAYVSPHIIAESPSGRDMQRMAFRKNFCMKETKISMFFIISILLIIGGLCIIFMFNSCDSNALGLSLITLIVGIWGGYLKQPKGVRE